MSKAQQRPPGGVKKHQNMVAALMLCIPPREKSYPVFPCGATELHLIEAGLPCLT